MPPGTAVYCVWIHLQGLEACQRCLSDLPPRQSSLTGASLLVEAAEEEGAGAFLPLCSITALSGNC